MSERTGRDAEFTARARRLTAQRRRIPGIGSWRPTLRDVSIWFFLKGRGLTIYDACRTLNMMKRLRLPGGDLEYAVLAKLWELGTASARDIHDQVGEPTGLVYTTRPKFWIVCMTRVW